MSENKTVNQNHLMQFIVACLVMVAFYVMSQVVTMQQQVLEGLCVHVQGTSQTDQTVEAAKQQIIDLQTRVDQVEQDTHETIGKLEDLHDDYTGCGAGPEDADADGIGFDESDDVQPLGAVLSDFFQMVKISGGEF